MEHIKDFCPHRENIYYTHRLKELNETFVLLIPFSTEIYQSVDFYSQWG